MRDTDRSPTAERLWRLLPPVGLSVGFVLVATLFLLGYTQAYSAILWQLGIDPFVFPFLDSHGVLSTAECHGYGYDVFVENPCDVLGRTLDYSPFWLVTTKFGLHTGLTPIVGMTLDVLFLFWIFFLPPARSGSQALVMSLALLSSAVGFALERANLDLAIFVIATVAAHWALRETVWRFFGYAFVMLAALIKFYPGIVLMLAIRERLVILCGLVVVTIAVTTIFVALEGNDILRALAQLEGKVWFTISFGAQNLSLGFAALLAHAFPRLLPYPIVVEIVFIVITIAAATAIAKTEELQKSLEFLSDHSRVMMLIGAALIVGCFFAAENAPYRAIYLLFALPGITDLWSAPISKASRQRYVLAAACALFLMWSPFLYRIMTEGLAALHVAPALIFDTRIAYWFLREIVWWWMIAILLAFLLGLIYQSQSGQQILSLFLNRSADGRKPRAHPAQLAASSGDQRRS